ncbi:SoxY-related AACIE arm protein [Vineibacter terrae]|uniref:SoxY-related AACIE arm protein n=1 Tax=Vineibacter terrae TaxID=2586908 RepID=A0A5C8PN26_9HYPH|nr:SoxY-related AACIE arm protein [Vineibacter terrae]TXL75432.1 SoxY-related AACIE arm protein [Vineibacter terrae]
MIDTSPETTRRAFLVCSTGSAAALALGVAPAQATPESLDAAIKAVVGTARLRAGKVTLDLPPLVENGNTVPMTVSVDSPMTESDHVTAIHVFNEKNPQPHVMSATLGPRAGKAKVSVRIKLNDSQKVVAIAQTSAGEFWTASADVIVTLAACVEDPT